MKQSLKCLEDSLRVDNVCYLRDLIIDVSEYPESIVVNIRIGWKTSKKLILSLVTKGFALRVQLSLYDACVEIVMLYISNTWVFNAEDL